MTWTPEGLPAVPGLRRYRWGQEGRNIRHDLAGFHQVEGCWLGDLEE